MGRARSIRGAESTEVARKVVEGWAEDRKVRMHVSCVCRMPLEHSECKALDIGSSPNPLARVSVGQCLVAVAPQLVQPSRTLIVWTTSASLSALQQPLITGTVSLVVS